MGKINEKPLLLSDVAQRLLWLDGAPFSLRDYPMFRAIYNGRYKSTLMLCGRQVSKSTSLANFMISESVALPFFRTYYVSPTKEQTLIFSNTRLGKTLSYSPLVRKHFQSPEHADRVLHRAYTNGSENAFTYACEDADRARGFSADRVCYDKDAQVLTRAGWKLVSEVTYSDELADVDNEGLVQWSRPTEIMRKKHTGEMVTFRHRSFHLRVTGDHKMWVNFSVKHSPAYKQEDRYEFVRASELCKTRRMGFKMTSGVKWSHLEPPLKVRIPGVATAQGHKRTSQDVLLKEFAQVVGWYISEGSLHWRNHGSGPVRPQPVIHQNQGRYLNNITSLLDSAGLKYHVNTVRGRDCRSVVIHSVGLGHYFNVLGKSYDKYIPREFFDFPELLEEVLKGIYLGDACYHKGESWQDGTLRTRSRRLAEDVQEAWLRLGRPASIRTRFMAPHAPTHPDFHTAKKLPIYEIRPCKRDYMVFWRADFDNKRRLESEQVIDEEVYCFTIKNHRPIVKGNFESKPVIGSNCYDEFQDMNYDAVVPVVNACMKNSKYRFETYAGTPKTMEASIQYLWDRSTQSEWVMKCEGCGKHSFVDSIKALGKNGPICLNCKKVLNPRNGFWVDMKKPDDPGRILKGFHIPQPIMPANIPACYTSPEDQEAAQSRWDDILHDLGFFSESKFKNEVLGVSDAIGTRLISLEELQELCHGPNMQPFPDHQGNMQGVSAVMAGVDWSGGGTTGVSRTVLWIWGWVPEKQQLRTLYFKIYPGSNPVHSVEDIAKLCNLFGVGLVVGDAGEGHLANATLRTSLGMHRVTAVQYGSFAKPMMWNGIDRYQIDRTTMIDNYLMCLKRKGAVYPPYEETKEPIRDILNVYEEVTKSGKKVWRHSPQLPDDALHAQLFGWLAWKIMFGDAKFYA